MNFMSSRFPENDTFLNHFNDLLSFFKPPEDFSWSQVLVVEQQSIIWKEIELIPKSALTSADEYEKRFDELLSIGYDWINMNAKGILDNAFIVQIEYPLRSINAPRNKVSVNYSGPSIHNEEPLWDLSTKVKILN
jgi:hypothetical protein